MKPLKTLLVITDFVITVAFFIMILLMFSGCGAKKVTSTTFKRDSISHNKEITLTKQSLDKIVFNEVCDSFGNLRPIFYEKTIGGNKTSVKSENGSIVIVKEQKTDTIKETEYIYKDKIIEKEKLIEKEKKYIPKLVWYSLILNIGLLAWIFRKPILKLINPIKI